MHLPIDNHIGEFLEALKSHDVVIVQSPPGSGKSTRIPPAIGKNMGRTAVLQPRRVAAKLICQRIADECGWSVGQEVGYRIRLESRVSPETQVELMTEGVLLRILMGERQLDKYDVVVIDEFHERSIHTDLICGWFRAQKKRPKLVIMSATLDDRSLVELFENPYVLNVDVSPHPLSVHYHPYSLNYSNRNECIDRAVQMAETAKKAHPEFGVLVFLPGKGEIEDFAVQMGRRGQTVEKLHGQLSIKEQQKIIRAHDGFRVVATTNIAETSLTVPGVRTVIDCGIEKVGGYEASTGEDYLYTQRISLASAKQRAGRAARLGPGQVYRIWSKSDETKMKPHSVPEVDRSDLIDGVFSIHHLNMTTASFPWVSRPSDLSIKNAERILTWMGLIKEDRLTDLGQKVAQQPTSVRLATVLEQARELNCYEHAVRLVSILERPPRQLISERGYQCDVEYLIDEIELSTEQKKIMSSFGPSKKNASQKGAAERVCRALMRAYPDRICRRRQKNGPRGKMTSGRGVKLARESYCKKFDFFIPLQIMRFQQIQSRESDVSMAGRCQLKWIKEDLGEFLTVRDEVKETAKTFQQQTDLGQLTIEEGKQMPFSDEMRGEVFVRRQLANWSTLLKDQDSLKEFLTRLSFAHHMGDLPPLDEEDKQIALEAAWDDIGNEKQVLKSELISYFKLALSEQDLALLETMYPERFQLGGRSRKVIYDLEKGAYVQMRIQEAFDVKELPKIRGGQLSIAVELLAPNQRPIQFTQNLKEFWKTSYPQIRKELKGRYPKHRWPEF